MGNFESLQHRNQCFCPTTTLPTATLPQANTSTFTDGITNANKSSTTVLGTQDTGVNNSIKTFFVSEIETSRTHSAGEFSPPKIIFDDTSDLISSKMAAENVFVSAPNNRDSTTAWVSGVAFKEDCFCLTEDNPWFVHYQITGILSVIISSVIILANLFVVANIVRSLHQHYKRRKIVHTKRSYIFILNLAVADLFVGFANVISFSVNQVAQDSRLFDQCLMEVCFVITPCCASVFTMTMLGVDRYLAVMHPFKYKQLITLKKALVVVIFVWVIAFSIGFAPLMGWGVEQVEYIQDGRICSYLYVIEPSYVIFTLFGGFLPQLFLIVYLYVQIFKVSRKHNMQISNLQNNRHPSTDNVFAENRFFPPAATHSCPVSPVGSISKSKTGAPPKRKPFRTVSFGPTAFEEDDIGSVISLESDESFNFKIPDQPNIRNFWKDGVFENHLNLPGFIHSQPLHRKNAAAATSGESARNSFTKTLNVGRLKRTVSYAGSAAINSISSQISHHFSNIRHDVMKRNIKALRTISLVIGFFFLMWTPFLIACATQKLCGQTCELQNLVGTYLLLLGVCNSAINPLVYTYTNKELKRQIRRCCVRKKRQVITDHEPVTIELSAAY